MARLINSKFSPILNVVIQTIFEDGSVSERNIAVGDIVENLRYVLNGELVTVSGKVTNIAYSVPTKISFSNTKPTDTFSNDITVSSITMDCSTEYQSNIVTIPAEEIVEDEGVENVARMKIFAILALNIKMYYSNRTMTDTTLQVGDKTDNVKIMTSTPGVDIVGEFEVVAFKYARVSSSKFNVTGVVLNNEERGTIIADFDKILSLTELMTYQTSSVEQVAEALEQARDGETIKLSGDVDADESAIEVEGKSITIDLGGKTIMAASSNDTGIAVRNGGILTIDGNGVIATETDYDSTHGNGVIAVEDGGTLNFNGGTINAVRPDPVNKGQFGIKVVGTSNVNINGGEFNTGWYGISTVGDQTNDDALITINDGTFNSVSDYAIYIPKGNLIVNGGTINGAAGAITVNGGVVEIHGGEFSCTGGGDTGDWVNGTGGLGEAVINLNARYSAAKCLITGGKFTTIAGIPIFAVNTNKNPVKLLIRGGLFNEMIDPSYLDPACQISEQKNADGYYEVSYISPLGQPLGEWP